jgi:hypothetical protein
MMKREKTERLKTHARARTVRRALGRATWAALVVSAIAAYSGTALADQDDVVFLKNGGRVVGTVMEESPDSGVRIKLADGTVRVILTADVQSVSYASAPALQAPSTARPAAPPAESSLCSKDTDCKGDRVCVAGACTTPQRTDGLQTGQPVPEPAKPNGWASGAAGVGIASAVTVLGLALGAEGTKAQGQVPSIPLGATATVILAAMVPVVAAGGLSARRSTGKEGIPGLRVAGWIAYGLALGNAVVLIAEGLGNTQPPPGQITGTGVLGAFSLVAFSADALASRNPALASPSSGGKSRAGDWTMAVAPVPESNGRLGCTVDVVGRF